jgi:hypothetical protein
MYGKPRPVPSPDRWRDRRARTGIHHQIDWYWQSFRMEVCGWRLCEWSGIIGRQAALTRWPLHLPVSDFRRTASPVRLRRFCRPETEWIQENSRRIHLHCWPFCGVPSVWSDFVTFDGCSPKKPQTSHYNRSFSLRDQPPLSSLIRTFTP